MLNAIFVAVVAGLILLAAVTGGMDPLLGALLDAARSAVELALGLVGAMAFFLGLMRVATDAGLMRVLTRLLAWPLRRLFPSVPPDHPAMGAMVLNISSNVLGLGNAATPFGVKAMMELDRLNGAKGTATNAMVQFLAINTSGLALLPTGILSLRASSGSHDVAGILAPTWIASGCAALAAVIASRTLARLPAWRASTPAPAADASSGPREEATAQAPGEVLSPPRFGTAVAVLYGVAFTAAAAIHAVRAAGGRPAMDVARELLSFWILPALIAGVVLYGWARGVRVYDSLVEGAKEGFSVALRIIPYLVAILAMVALARASGAMDALARALAPWSGPLGIPAEVLPIALLRPLSGSGTYGLLAELMKTHGPDSFLGYLASAIQGSTETTFYVLAVYFGAVGIRRTRHTVPVCLLVDATGILMAVVMTTLVFGHLR